ncbi:hypothetical protein F-liban_250 [Faustovirus]|nr:hypothetical protein F-liban_250 [Faustovirus]SME64927.1 Hypothetical protein FSTVST1_241 [Faustovirus ST1]
MDQQFDIILQIAQWVSTTIDLSMFKCVCWVWYQAMEYLIERAKTTMSFTTWICTDTMILSYCGSRNTGSYKYCQTMHDHKNISIFDIIFKPLTIGYLITQILPKIHSELPFDIYTNLIVTTANKRCCWCIKLNNKETGYSHSYDLHWGIKITNKELIVKPVWICRQCSYDTPFILNNVLVIKNIPMPSWARIDYYRKVKPLYNDIKNKLFGIRFIEQGNVGSLYF